LRIALLLALLALTVAVLVVGCKRTKGVGEETASAGEQAVTAQGDEGAEGTEVAAAGQGAARASRRGGGTRGGRGGRAGRAGAGAPAEGEQVPEAPGPAGEAPAEQTPREAADEQAAEEAGAGAAAGPAEAETGIAAVDTAAKLRDFAAIYGPTTRVDEKDWDGHVLQSVIVSYDGDDRLLSHIRGKQIKLPLDMIENADYMETLEGYFPIYVAAGRPSGEVVSKETITAPRREPRSLKELRELQGAKRKAAAAVTAAAGEGETVAAGAGPAAGSGGPAGRGGRGGRRGRGGRF